MLSSGNRFDKEVANTHKVKVRHSYRGRSVRLRLVAKEDCQVKWEYMAHTVCKR